MARRADQIRRMIVAGRARDSGVERDRRAEERSDVARLQEQVERLESVVEGLQDSIQRESRRTDQRFGELGARLQPAEKARALDAESRRQGAA